MRLHKKILIVTTASISILTFSQKIENIRPVLTGAPFLRIAPDARSGGMADQGVATSPDTFSQFWNAAKYPFSYNSSSFGASYTPYMNKLANDMFLLYATYNSHLGGDNNSSISASIYYFNMGSVDLTTISGTQITENGTAKPNEFSLDLAYALKLSEHYSMAVTARYVRSDLGSFSSNNTIKAANSFAVDVAGYFQSNKHESIGNLMGKARAGFAIQNLGPKLNYGGNDDSRSYLPTIGRLGAGYDFYIDNDNSIGLTLEASKLLVPGAELNSSGVLEIPNVGVISGIGDSFSNKKSVMMSVASEYKYRNDFALRAGYFRESEEQGGRQFATVGIGLKYQSFGLDVSYLINTSNINSALDNTLRFGLTWNVGQDNVFLD